MRRGLATLLTLGTLFTFLLAVVVGLMLYVGFVSLPIAVALVVLVNVVTLLVSPWINDLIYRWLYDLEWVDPEEFRRRSPRSVAVVDEVTVEGWFFRLTSPWMGLRRLRSGDRTIKGFVHLGSYAGGVVAVVLGAVVLAVPLFL